MPPPAPSLYERVGGHRQLGVLVRNFYLSLQTDPTLGPIFARHVKSWPAHYATLTEFWALQTGGPSAYGGKLLPQVIFEVLSPSTAAFDRGDKFNRYRLLESLTDYVLIAVDRMQVEHHTRLDDGTWRLTEYHQPADAVPLVSLGCELPLAEIYEKITLPPPTP